MKSKKSIRQRGRDWIARQPAAIRARFATHKPWYVYRIKGTSVLATVVGATRARETAGDPFQVLASVVAYTVPGGGYCAADVPFEHLVRVPGKAMRFNDEDYRRKVLVDALTRDAVKFGMIPKGARLTEEMVFQPHDDGLTIDESSALKESQDV